MILHSIAKSVLFRKIGTLFYLSSHINKTYGSINKPLNQFGQNSKYIDPKQSIIDQHPTSTNTQTTLESDQKPSNYPYEDQVNKDKTFRQKKNKEVAFFFDLDDRGKLNVIEEYRQKQMIKELSIICREMYFYRQKSDAVWSAIEKAFVYFLRPPYDQDKIRSLSMFLNGLSKAKRLTQNYEGQMMELMPLSSVQSFTQIVVMISRTAPMSEQFITLVEQLYLKRKEELGPLEMNLINYALAKNGRQIDTTIIQKIDTFNLRSIALMLKAFDRSGNVTTDILKKCVQPIISQKAETTYFDLKHLINVYFKHQYFESFHLLHYFDEQYRLQSSQNLNQDSIENIWQFFPEAMNKNKLPPTFVDQVIKTLIRFKKSNKISDGKWRYIELSFNKIQNKEIREKLKKLSGP